MQHYRFYWLAIFVACASSTIITDYQLARLEGHLNNRVKRQLFGKRRKTDQNIFPGKNSPSIIYQGLYIPDPRFNSFEDGIITNMVSDMRASSLDPVYFRINSRGRVTAHETRGRVNSIDSQPAALSSAITNSRKQRTLAAVPDTHNLDSLTETAQGRGGFGSADDGEADFDHSIGRMRRKKRQLSPSRSYSTALLEGLTNINRRGDVDVQVASNVTLVRARWLLGPLVYRVNYYESRYTTRSLATEIPPIQMDTVTQISYIGADMADFVLGCPLMTSLRFLGNVTSRDQSLANKALHNLFQFDSFMYEAVRDTFQTASYARLPLYSSTRSNDNQSTRTAADGSQRTNALLLLGRRKRRVVDTSETNQAA